MILSHGVACTVRAGHSGTENARVPPVEGAFGATFHQIVWAKEHIFPVVIADLERALFMFTCGLSLAFDRMVGAVDSGATSAGGHENTPPLQLSFE